MLAQRAWGFSDGAEMAADAYAANPGMTQNAGGAGGGSFMLDEREPGSARVTSAGNDAFGSGVRGRSVIAAAP